MHEKTLTNGITDGTVLLWDWEKLSTKSGRGGAQ